MTNKARCKEPRARFSKAERECVRSAFGNDKLYKWAVRYAGVELLKSCIQKDDYGWGDVDLDFYVGLGDDIYIYDREDVMLPHQCGAAVMCADDAFRLDCIKKWVVHASLSRFRHIICTINSEQKVKYNLLKKAGFKVIADWMVNPNTGNKIAMFLFTIPE